MENLGFLEHPDFLDYAKQVREGMADSAMCVSLVPHDGATDAKFAVELGYAIMLDKPIIAVVPPGRTVPDGLRRVAYAVVEADMGAEGRRKLKDVVFNLLADLHQGQDDDHG